MTAEEIDPALRAAGKPERAQHEQRYLESEPEHFGNDRSGDPRGRPGRGAAVPRGAARARRGAVGAAGRPQLVFDWLLPRAGRASRLTVREAVKHLPEAQREAILSARAAGWWRRG